MTRNLWIGIIVVFFFIGGDVVRCQMSVQTTGEETNTFEPMYTPHEPCRINNNLDFLFSSCVVNGNGSIIDPYIIEGWDINGSEKGYAIYIGNTTNFFKIRNSYFHDIEESRDYLYGAGIRLFNVINGTIENNLILNNSVHGIWLAHSNNNSIISNIISNNGENGICIEEANHNLIHSNSIFLNRGSGIEFGYLSFPQLSEQNQIEYNTIHNNSFAGIYVKFTSNNIIHENRIQNNNYTGILIWESNYNNYSENQFINNGFKIVDNSLDISSTQYIDTTNSANDKSIYYIVNTNGGRIPTDAGQVILVNVTNMTISDLVISNVECGLQIFFSNDNSIKRNVISLNNYSGAVFEYSNNNTISENKFMGTSRTLDYTTPGDGLNMKYSNNNTIINNTFTHNKINGIRLWYSHDNTIRGNHASNNSHGIEIWASQNIKITNTKFSNNYDGILSYDSHNMIIHMNEIESNEMGICFQGSFENNITSNTFHRNNFSIIFYFGSNNNSIISNLLTNGTNAIVFSNSPNNDNKVLHNTILDHLRYGIYSHSAMNTEIAYNTIADTKLYGIYLEKYSERNIIHHNAFRNNNVSGGKQALDLSGNNSWNTSSEGNHWSDYDEPSKGCYDNNFNGICDSPYSIAGFIGTQDYYPLTNRSSITQSIQIIGLILLLIIVILVISYLIKRKRMKFKTIKKQSQRR